MRFWLDTEFHERGHAHPIDFISVGVVAEDGREYTAVSSQFDLAAAQGNWWLAEHVLPYLGDPSTWKRREQIAADLIEFCGHEPELWSYYADYDWVVVCQLFGTMMDLPSGWPMWCRDIKQWCEELGNPKLPDLGEQEHEVLSDARDHRFKWSYLKGLAALRPTGSAALP